MIDVLILANLYENEFTVETLGKFNGYKKYFCKIIKEILNSNDISNNIISNYDRYNSDEVKCFFNIEIKKTKNKSYVEIFSPRVINKSYELASNLSDFLGAYSELNYESVNFDGSDLPYEVSKLYLTLYLNEESGEVENFINKISKLTAMAIGKYLGINVNSGKEKENINIINGQVINRNKAKQFSKNLGLDEKIIGLIDYYWELGPKHGGVDPLVAYIQSIITISQKKVSFDYFNPGGIKDSKVTIATGVYDYKKFATIKEGVEAQLDHLALFAGAEGYPKAKTSDPRHFKYLFGCCKNIEGLTGKWDVDKEYGNKVLKLYNEVNKIKDFEEFREESILVDSIEDKVGRLSEKIVSMGSLLESVFKEYSFLYKELENFKKEISSIEEEKNLMEIEKIELEKKITKQKMVIKDILNVIGGSLEKK